MANAPVQARWAKAQRAGPASPDPPTVACKRLLGRPILGADCKVNLISLVQHDAFLLACALL
jgi:hypothetical protein